MSIIKFDVVLMSLLLFEFEHPATRNKRTMNNICIGLFIISKSEFKRDITIENSTGKFIHILPSLVNLIQNLILDIKCHQF